MLLEPAGRGRGVAGEHDHPAPVRREVLDDRLPALAHLVADDENASDGPVPADVHGDATRLASVRADRVKRLGHGPRVALEQRPVTDDDLVAVDPSGDACP